VARYSEFGWNCMDYKLKDGVRMNAERNYMETTNINITQMASINP
jgi:hypothetical protein